jgi:hypothetical protein
LVAKHDVCNANLLFRLSKLHKIDEDGCGDRRVDMLFLSSIAEPEMQFGSTAREPNTLRSDGSRPSILEVTRR